MKTPNFDVVVNKRFSHKMHIFVYYIQTEFYNYILGMETFIEHNQADNTTDGLHRFSQIDRFASTLERAPCNYKNLLRQLCKEESEESLVCVNFQPHSMKYF